jgi:hypothetical protein
VAVTGNPNNLDYPRYGGRGIRNCFPNFRSFEQQVLSTLGEPPDGFHSKLNRKDINGDYVVGNLQWAPADRVGRHSRRASQLTWNNRTQNLRDWAEQYGIGHTTLYSRLERGWTLKKALTTPVRAYHS